MTATMTHRGHQIYYDSKTFTWRYADNDEAIENNERPCKRCGHLPTQEGYDYCLGHIKGAKSACCGHGIKEGFVMYDRSFQKNNLQSIPERWTESQTHHH